MYLFSDFVTRIRGTDIVDFLKIAIVGDVINSYGMLETIEIYWVTERNTNELKVHDTHR